MRVLGVLIMATGLLGAFMGDSEAASPKQNAPKPNAMKLEAPSSNPLDAVMDDIYRREMSGQITHDQAMTIYNNAVDQYMAKDKRIVEEHGKNMLKRFNGGQ